MLNYTNRYNTQEHFRAPNAKEVFSKSYYKILRPFRKIVPKGAPGKRPSGRSGRIQTPVDGSIPHTPNGLLAKKINKQVAL